MHDNSHILYLDHLQPDEELTVSCTLDPIFLELSVEDEAQPLKPVVVEGVCSLVDGCVMLDLLVHAFFSVRCALCNETFEYEVRLDRFRHQEMMENIDQRKWDLRGLLREAIVIELPFFPLCGGNECLHKDEIRKYFASHLEEKEEEKSSPFHNFFDTVQ